MRGLADQRDAMRGDLLRLLERQRKDAAPGSTRILPRCECDCRSTSRARSSSASVASRVGVRRPHHPDHARALARQGHQRERTVRGVELGRGAVVRPGVRDVERQRGSVGSAGWRYSIPAAARQIDVRPSAPITRRRAKRFAVPAADRRHPLRRSSTASASSSIRIRAGNSRRARLERLDECAVLDVVAEGSRPISSASKRSSGARISRPLSSTSRMTRAAPR